MKHKKFSYVLLWEAEGPNVPKAVCYGPNIPIWEHSLTVCTHALLAPDRVSISRNIHAAAAHITTTSLLLTLQQQPQNTRGKNPSMLIATQIIMQ